MISKLIFLIFLYLSQASCSNFTIATSIRGNPQLYDFSQGNAALQNFTYDFGCWGQPDPTHSHSDYASGCVFQNELVTVKNGSLYISIKNDLEAQCDTGIDPSYKISSCYPAIRLQSLDTYNTNPAGSSSTYSYLFVIKTKQIPDSCSLWPAWWLCGAISWPTSGSLNFFKLTCTQGEFDIIESVNGMQYNGVTGHTTNGCSYKDVQSNVVIPGKSTWKLGTQEQASSNCYVDAFAQYTNAGCGTNYQGTNQQGTFVTLWSQSGYKVFYWNYNDASASAVGGPLSASPQPAQWTNNLHMNFTYGKECNHTHFYDMNIIINTAICGDWAGSVFGSDCTGMGSCESYIASSKFQQAIQTQSTMWVIDQIRVYKQLDTTTDQQ